MVVNLQIIDVADHSLFISTAVCSVKFTGFRGIMHIWHLASVSTYVANATDLP